MKSFRIIFLILVILVAAFDICQSCRQAIIELQKRTGTPLHSLGYQFMGLENIFQGVHTVGYYTDKDLSATSTNTLAIAQFEQAQYMLVPTVLDLNHTQYHWVIFDCTSPDVAMNAIKDLGFTPVKIHNGIILAENPNGV